MADVLKGPGYIDTTYPDKWTDDPFFVGIKPAKATRKRGFRSLEEMVAREAARSGIALDPFALGRWARGAKEKGR